MSKDDLFKLELRISSFLRWGVIIAGVFLLIGWTTLMDFSHNPLAAFQTYNPVSLPQSLNLALEKQQWGLLISYTGLIILISLPLLRVLLTGILFVKQKEKPLAAIAFLVFAILLLSISLGLEL